MDELKYTILMILIAIAIIFGVTMCNMHIDDNAYNDGIHRDCGGHWIYQQAVSHKYKTDFLFKCDKCGKLEEFDHSVCDIIYYEDGSTYSETAYVYEEPTEDTRPTEEADLEW